MKRLACSPVIPSQKKRTLLRPALLVTFGLCVPQIAFAAAPVIPLTVNLSETVTVTGTPQVALDVGGQTRYATYTAGSGSSALTFTYTAQLGDVDLDGITLVSPLQLNGGTIKDAVGNDAALTFTLPNTSGIKVNYPSLGIDFVYDADGRYTLNGTAYNDLTSFLSATGGSFTRASVGTYYDSTGVLQTAASSVPRFDFDPVTHTPRGLLVEEARTNLFLRSSELDNATWTKSNTTVTANTATAPDGTLTADTLTRTSLTSNLIRQLISKATSPITYTASLYAKQGTARYLAVRMQGAYPPRADVVFDLQSGVISSAATAVSTFSGASASIQAVGNGWYRVSLTATTDSVTLVTLYMSPHTTSVTVDQNDASSTADLYIWGVQFEQAPFPTSYIPTTSATVTRAADTLTLPTSGWLTQGVGTVVSRFMAPPFLTGTKYPGAWAIDDGTINNALQHVIFDTEDNAVGSVLFNNNNNQYEARRAALATANELLTQAFTYTQNDARAALSGILQGGDLVVDVPLTFTTLRLGARRSGIDPLNGWIQKLSYYPSRVANAQLPLLAP